MNDALIYSTLHAAMNSRYRGHDTRDWQVWRDRHLYASATAIPHEAEKAMIHRAKDNVEGLGERQHLVHLIAGNVDQAMLDDIGQLHGLERLELEWPMLAENLSPLAQLSSLRFLSINSPRKVTDFAVLAAMPNLRTLMIENAKHLASIDWLAGAHHLQVIGIEGAIDNKQTLASLSPLAGLAGLEAFLGTSLRLLDGDLMPLATCPNLRFLGIARVAKKPEFDRLRAARPDVTCTWFDDSMWLKPGLRPA
jgi:hypothetical protein